MKLEVGMYAYSKHSRDYGIGKIVNIHTNGFANQEVEIQYKDVKLSTSYDDVIASHELIDLIDLGDYVNGYKVLEICTGNFELNNPLNVKALKLEFIKEDINPNIPFFKRYNFITNSEIKSIITKEQFESVKYEVNR